MKAFRGKKVIGWRVVNSTYKEDFENELNSFMDIYDFIDCQYATNTNGEYSALVLLSEKLQIDSPGTI